MKNLKIAYLLLTAFFISLVSYGQQRAVTSIQQNVNDDAHGLEQKLNFTLDTLTLRSTTDILRVTFLDHNAKDSHIIDVGNKEIKIPLYHFKKGRYTIAVYPHHKIIALGANRINDIPVPKDAVADLEESILRASLTDDQLTSRNIKPRKKKPTITKEKDTRIAKAKPKRDIKPKPKRVVKPKPKAKVKDTRVAAVTKKPSKKPTVKRPVKKVAKTINKPKRKTRSKSKGKSALAIALEKKAQEKVKRAAAKKEFTRIKNEKDVAANDVADESIGTLLTVKKVTYNLSNVDSETIDKQTRAEYRANNLRPNGTPYED